MTISSENPLFSGPYVGDGAVTIFDYGFKIYAEGEAYVVRTNADLTETVLALGADYTVTGVGEDGGGTIVLLDAATLPVGASMVITPSIEISQDRPFSDQSSIDLEEIEQSLDKLTSIGRMLKGFFNRTPLTPVGNENLTLPSPSVGQVLMGTINGWINGPTADQITAAQADATAANAAADAAAQSAADAAAAEASLLKNRGTWLTATDYVVGDIVQEGGTSYHCDIPHTSAVFADDFAAGRWTVFAAMGNPGAGTGDMQGANNLSDVASAAAAFANVKQAASETVTGVVEVATTAETTAGTANKFPDAAKIKALVDAAVAAIPRWKYIGPLTAYTTNTFTTEAHGLASPPTDWAVLFEATIANNGYAVGDQLLMPATGGHRGGQFGYNVCNDANGTDLVFSRGVNITITNKAGTGEVSLGTTNWKYRLLATN